MIGRSIGAVVITCGVAHFIWPQRFEPLNHILGFGRNTRIHVYINGAVESTIGMTMLSPATRKLNVALAVAYPTYLALNRGLSSLREPNG